MKINIDAFIKLTIVTTNNVWEKSGIRHLKIRFNEHFTFITFNEDKDL